MTKAIVNLDLPGPLVSRHQHGHFAEHLGHCIYEGIFVGADSEIPNDKGIRLDVVEALKEIGIPNLRWPGGCFADDYHWRDGIGTDRPTVVNSLWGDVVEDNSFGTHEFMHLIDLLETEPYICGNVGSGTVQEMSQWVEYLTRGDDSPMARLRRSNGRDEPWAVKFWGVGNESWGCGGNMRPEHYADLARQYGTYCRDHGENRLYRIACGANVDDYAWTQALMSTIGDLGCGCRPADHFQGLSLHHYTFGKSWEEKGSATEFDTDDYFSTMANAWRMDELIARHSTIMDVYDPTRRIGLIVDEWGTWWEPEPGSNPGFLVQRQTLRDALVASVTLDIFHAHAERVEMANLAQAVNVLQAVLVTDGATLTRTPTWHVFEMNQGHGDGNLLPVQWNSRPTRSVPQEGPRPDVDLPLLHASVTVKDGRVLASATNLALEPQDVDLELRGGAVSLDGARLLTAADLHDEEVSVTAFDGASLDGGVLRLRMPATSYVVAELRLEA